MATKAEVEAKDAELAALKQMLADLQKQNEQYKGLLGSQQKPLTLKIQDTPKDIKDDNGKVIGQKPPTGALSLYGTGRFPVTLYVSQWERLIEFAPAITEFIKANRSKLASKPKKSDTVESTEVNNGEAA